jgi:multidrug efflux pump subunit AcrA (membrane-fusion protein)
MKIKGRILFFIILLLIIGIVVFRVLTQPNQSGKVDVSLTPVQQQERIVPVEVVKVKQGEIKSFLTVSGLVEPAKTVRVNAKILGEVKEVLVIEGDEVKKGDLLLRLDDEQIRIQVAQAKAAFDSAQATLEKLKAGARPQEIRQAEAALQQAKVSRDSAEENYLRIKKLFAEGAVSEQQHDQAKVQFEIAEAQYQAAYERYELIKEGPSEQDVKTVEAQVRQAQSALEMVQTQLSNTLIKAPISGRVTGINVKIGEMVSTAVPLLSILDVSELFVKAGIPEKDIAYIHIGQEAEILIDAFPNLQFKGEVTSKGVTVDSLSKRMEIKIKIISPSVEIPPGVFARANIVVAKNPEALIVPITALIRKSEGIYVFVLKGEIAEKRAVVTGITQGNEVEIVQGLQKDEEVVVVGNLTLEDGDRVKIINRGQDREKEENIK